MNSFFRTGISCFMVLSVMAAPNGWATDAGVQNHTTSTGAGVPATVTKVEKDAVVVMPNGMSGSEIRIVRSDDGSIKVGDQVLVAKDRLEKIKSETGNLVAPGTAGDALPGEQSVGKSIVEVPQGKADPREK